MILNMKKTLFLFFTCLLTYSYGLKILGVFPINGKSHSVIQISIMKDLAAKGHQVDVYSHFPLKKPIPNYTDFSLKGSTHDFINNMTYDAIKMFMDNPSIDKLINQVGKDICELMDLPIFQKLFKNPPKYDVVITEVFSMNCYLGLGRYFNAPLVGISCPPLLFDWVNHHVGNPVNLATDNTLFSRSTAPLNFFERLQNFITVNAIILQADYHMTSQNKYIEKYFGQGYPNAIDIQKDLSLVLLNYNPVISGIRPFAPVTVPIAGVHIQDHDDPLEKDLKKWLDESEAGFIYFTFGSMVRIETFPKHVIDAIYASFKKIAPVRVLMKVAKVEDLPAGLPDNVMTHSWFNQIQVLKHKNIKAFMTHGGLLGTQESIYFGVPLIGIPLFGDQHFNINTYVQKKIAVKVLLDEITEKSLSDALNKILNNPIYKNNAEKISKRFRDVPVKPLDSARYWIEYVARHGKDALRSPSVDMPWWQVNLLDVYGFILLVTLIVYYVLKKLVKTILSCLFFSKSQSEKNKND